MEDPEKSGMLDGNPALKYQLEFLKMEFEAVNQSIARIEKTTQGTKNWAVIVWARSLGMLLANKELHGYIPLTSTIPFLFWFIDAQWRKIQRSFIFRIRRISNFLNGPAFQESMRKGVLTDFTIVDPGATNDKDTKEYREFTSIHRTLRFKEVAPFYLGLVAISIVAAFVLNW